MKEFFKFFKFRIFCIFWVSKNFFLVFVSLIVFAFVFLYFIPFSVLFKNSGNQLICSKKSKSTDTPSPAYLNKLII
ncbi:unnamed protein product [Meloidogyne enterolobii]|uniref:Uncharacterized protein n=1 Tax=Meloidogyne enterolobii TaxID=390850 RepID=A0ACB0YUA2_MELEN